MKNYTNSFKAVKVSEVRLKYFNKVKAADRFKIKSSKSAYTLVKVTSEPEDLDCNETCNCIYLNNSNEVLAVEEISRGGITGTLVDVRNVMASALKLRAVAIILWHNHPSRTLKPSHADKELTKKIKTACEALDIKLLDHLIVTVEDYFSFADESIL